MSKESEDKSAETTPKQRRGFSLISPERRREISSAGGRAAQATGKAYRLTSEKAREAGKKGGQARWAKRNAAPKTDIAETPDNTEGDSDAS